MVAEGERPGIVPPVENFPAFDCGRPTSPPSSPSIPGGASSPQRLLLHSPVRAAIARESLPQDHGVPGAARLCTPRQGHTLRFGR